MKREPTPARLIARPHPHYSALCILPNGKNETKAKAEADGYIVQATPVRPAPAKVAMRPPVVPVKPAFKPSAAVLADRARMTRIIALTPRGRETECDEAIRSGMSVADYEALLAARAIGEAVGRFRGR